MKTTDVYRLSLSAEQARRCKSQILKSNYPRGDNDVYALSPQEAIEIVERANRSVNDNFVLATRLAQAIANEFLGDALAKYAHKGGPDAAVIDLGREFIEIDLTLHMPVNGRRNPLKPFSVDEIILLAIIMAAGGSPFSLIPEAGLDLIMPVSPVAGREKSPSSKGGGRLGWHVDNMPFARAYRPDFFALMGLVSTERVMTSFILVDDILAALRQISAKHERTLREPFFRFLTPASFHLDGSPQILSDPVALIEDDPDGRPIINFNEYSLVRDGDDPDICAALDALNHVLRNNSVVHEEWIEPGKILLISNTRALHARGEVRGQRYLARLYGKRDLSALRALPSGGDWVYRSRFMMTTEEMGAACCQQTSARKSA